MSSVGETLRRERLRAGLDLDRIAQDTKISTRTLELIEADQFEKLPGGVFARSFVRQYARAVGVDEDEMVREMERFLEPVPPPLSAAQDLDRREVKLPRVSRWGGGRWSGIFWTRTESRVKQNSSLPALVLVALVMIACSGAYTWWQKSRRPAPEGSQHASVQTPAQPVPAPQANRGEEPPTAPNPQPVASTVSEDFATGTLHLALTAAEPTWVQARANGKVVFSGVIQPNETKSLDAADTVTLKIGNAGGISISLNGKSIPQLGPKGQVRVVQVSPDGGIQVEQPKPPSPQLPAQQTQTL